MITALLLDVDDTLIDTRTAMVAAGQAAVARLWPQTGVEMRHAAGVHFQSDPSGFFGRFADGEMSFPAMRAARVADLLEAFSLSPVEEGTRRFDDVYEAAFIANVRLFDDVLPLVRQGETAGIRIGLLTNSSCEHTQRKLQTTGLTGAFSSVATRDSLGFGKPDPRAFHHGCLLLRSAPAETIYVGDDLEIDAIAAGDAGLSAVWLQREACQPKAGARARARGIPMVSSLSQVLALLTAS